MKNAFQYGVLVAALALSGCASSGRVGELPVLQPGQPSAKLTVIRVSSIVGLVNSYYVALDGKDVFSIRSGQHTEFRVGAGERYIGVKCFGGFTPTWKEDGLKFAAEPNAEYYFEISPSMSCAQIKAIEPAEARKQIAGSKFIPSDTKSGSK